VDSVGSSGDEIAPQRTGEVEGMVQALKGGADVGGGSLRLDSHSCTDASAGHRYRGGNEFGPAFGDEVTVPVEKQKPNRNAFTIGFLLDCKLNYLHNIAT
jgi:hypothetical protein